MRFHITKEGRFVLVMLGGLVAAVFSTLYSDAQRGRAFQRYSTLRAEPDGAAALFELVAAGGGEPRRSKRSLIGLPSDATVVLIGTAQGLSYRYEERELKAIEQWVRRGGRLLVLSAERHPILPRFECEVGVRASEVLVHASTLGSPGRATPMPPTVPTAGVGRPSIEAAPIRVTELTASGAPLAVRAKAVLELSNPAWLPLYRSEEGVVAAALVVGDDRPGLVVAVSDPFIATNEGIALGGNAAFLGSIIAGEGRVVIFDELRHGLRSQQGILGYLRSHRLHLLFLQLGLVFAVFWWAASARLARIRAPEDASGVEASAYLTALANIYLKAGLQGHAIRWFEGRLVAALRELLGRPELKGVEDFDREAVALRLREIGVKNYQGFAAYLDYRSSLLARLGGKLKRAADGSIDWASVHGLPEGELVATVRLAIKLERDWSSQGKLRGIERAIQLQELAGGEADGHR